MSVSTKTSKRIIQIANDTRSVDVSDAMIHFRYYESLFSPYVSATFEYVDTGTIKASSEDDTQERLGTLISSLPLRGNEKVNFKFESAIGDLDFMTIPLIVDGAVILGKESTKESGSVRLISHLYRKNQTTFVVEKYYGNISTSVSKIIKEKLGVDDTSRVHIDPTSRPWNFTGSNIKPFDLLLEMASKSSPPKGDPGYFFYETKSGVHFKSIDSLVSQDPKFTYTYDGVFKSDLKDGSNSFNILQSPNKRDQSISKSLRAGMYSAKFRFMYEDTQECIEKEYTLDEKNESTLGKDVEVDPELKINPSRTYTMVIPTGMMDTKVGNEKNNDPKDYLARSVMRYNLLFVQAMNIVVPCNPELEAGDVIQCNLEKITIDDKTLGSTDENESGKYLILNLCHYFDNKNSYTYLTLVRDTYGEGGVAA
tara:strand:- start:1792 stop:3063 length:1272 start_codon:yes stop_codon:yes gene_type:complete